MNAIEKLSAVEIKPDACISAHDRAFCQAHQKAYEAARVALAELGAIYADITEQQCQFLDLEQKDYRRGYIALSGLDQRDINDKIESLHDLFIDKLANHFRGTYQVTVLSELIKERLLPQKPSYDSWRIDVEAHDRYREEMQNIVLRYEDVVDAIIEQLDGCTFTERALAEMKEKCHQIVWIRHTGQARFEVQGDTIRFTFHACSYDDWSGWSLDEEMQDILRAVAHFETGEFACYPPDIDRFLGYRNFPCAEYDLYSSTTLCRLKMFKNHRVDLKFKSKEMAQQFADTYFGTVC